MTRFAKQLTAFMRDRGIKSDEQLAQRAMSVQEPDTRRINVHARTINNWRNGRSKPRSLEDPRLVLVLKALAVSEEDMSSLAQTFENATADGAPRSHWLHLPPWALRAPRKLVLAALVLLMLSGIVIFSAHSLGPPEPDNLTEIPPTELRLSKDGFVLPDSAHQIVRQDQLERLSGWELYVARNEIFARHGRPFVQPSSGCLQRHFDRWAKSVENEDGWYVRRSGSPLASDLEYQNAATIRSYECRVRGGQYTCNGRLNPCR